MLYRELIGNNRSLRIVVALKISNLNTLKDHSILTETSLLQISFNSSIIYKRSLSDLDELMKIFTVQYERAPLFAKVQGKRGNGDEGREERTRTWLLSSWI